ncbi:MAG: restriction endonuclease subunit S [Bacteroidales bacterium]|jgi:hypothetical protein|nr:restriction endonuclease subunit S [Bacteroidales bacterium]
MMSNFVPVAELFNINYGNSLELVNMEQCQSIDINAVPFISRTENNNGVSAFVKEELDIELNSCHTLTVAVGGSVLSTFYQPLPYYTGFHVLVLSPKEKMSVIEMLFYAECIKANKYKYNYGRQANKTLKDILIPNSISQDSDRINKLKKIFLKTISNVSMLQIGSPLLLSTSEMSDWVKTEDLFDTIYGINLELVNLTQCKSTDIGAVPFVSRTENNNGVSAFVKTEIDIDPNPAHTLSVAGGGSVLATFYQPLPYYSGRDLYVLIPKIKMSAVEMLFYAECIKANRYKYNYGRQANKTLRDILVPSRIPEGLSERLKSKQMIFLKDFQQYINSLSV